MKINTKNDALKLVQAEQASFQASLTAAKQAGKDHRESGHERVHRTVASAYVLATALLANEVVLGEVMAHFNVTVRAGANPFFAVAKVIFRKPSKGGGTEFDKSTGKYANSWRYFRDEEWPVVPEEIVDRLRDLKLEVDGNTLGKLKATEAADRARYREDAGQELFEQAAFEHLLEQPGEFEVPGSMLDVEGGVEGQFIALAFSYDAQTGGWALRHRIDTKSDQVKRQISKKVQANFKLINDEFFLRLAEANEETDAANSMPPAMRRMIARQKAQEQAEQFPLPEELFEEAEGDAEPDPELAPAAANG